MRSRRPRCPPHPEEVRHTTGCPTPGQEAARRAGSKGLHWPHQAEQHRRGVVAGGTLALLAGAHRQPPVVVHPRGPAAWGPGWARRPAAVRPRSGAHDFPRPPAAVHALPPASAPTRPAKPADAAAPPASGSPVPTPPAERPCQGPVVTARPTSSAAAPRWRLAQPPQRAPPEPAGCEPRPRTRWPSAARETSRDQTPSPCTHRAPRTSAGCAIADRQPRCLPRAVRAMHRRRSPRAIRTTPSPRPARARLRGKPAGPPPPVPRYPVAMTAGSAPACRPRKAPPRGTLPSTTLETSLIVRNRCEASCTPSDIGPSRLGVPTVSGEDRPCASLIPVTRGRCYPAVARPARR